MGDEIKSGRRDWPQRPAKLQHYQSWVTVLRVIDGTGVPSDEMAWAMIDDDVRAIALSGLFTEAAKTWWHETDQCGECGVELRAEIGDGNVFVKLVRLRVQIKAELEPGGVR